MAKEQLRLEFDLLGERLLENIKRNGSMSEYVVLHNRRFALLCQIQEKEARKVKALKNGNWDDPTVWEFAPYARIWTDEDERLINQPLI